MEFSWLIYTIIFIVFQITFLQTFKYATKNTKNIGALTVTVQLISAVSILVLIPFFEWALPTNWLTWLLLGISLLLYAINDRLDATTRKNLDISVDTMLHQVYRIFFLFAGIIFLGRTFIWLKLAGAILIVCANIFLLSDKGKFKFNKYVLLKVLSALFFAAAFTLETYNSASFNLAFFVFLSFSIPAIFLMIGRQATPRTLLSEIKRKEWWVILICGISQSLMCFAILRAYQFQDYFIEVATISAAYVILNVFFAYFILKERSNLLKKICVAIAIVGLITMMVLV